MKFFIITLTFACMLAADPAGVIETSDLHQSTDKFTSHYQKERSVRPLIPSHEWMGDTTELLWDDGTAETDHAVTTPSGRSDRFAVSFKPKGPFPMKLVGGRLYSDVSLKFRSYSVCPDAGGYPDIFHPIDEFHEPEGASPGWATCSFSGSIFDTSTIWAVALWYPGYHLRIGGDETAPDGFSYWSHTKEGLDWEQMATSDFMMRLSVATVTDSHDVTTTMVLEPAGHIRPGDKTRPTAVFANMGLSANTFKVTFDILDLNNTVVYTSSDDITLASAEVDTHTFASEWTGNPEGVYTCKAYTSLPGDADQSDDTASRQTLCDNDYLITYCGDITSHGSGIVGDVSTNRKFMVRMTPPVSPPYYIKKAQVMLAESNAPLEYVCVCPDNGSGKPDTTVKYAIANNISVIGGFSWAPVDFGEVEVTQPGDIWLMCKWFEGITPPHIGVQSNNLSGRCWRYLWMGTTLFYETVDNEYYFRLIISKPTLCDEDLVIGTKLPTFLNIDPNPFLNNTEIRFMIHDSQNPVNKPDLKIYDASGRLVKSFNFKSNTTNHESVISWTGCDSQNRPLPAGVYFVMLKNNDKKITKKAVILR